MTDTHVDAVAAEIAIEQQHLDRVHAELAKAGKRADLVAVDGMSRGRTDRTGDVRDEEMSGLFERDALVFNAARRMATLEHQYEGLVFGRLDLGHAPEGADQSDREVRYIGRLGVRDDDYEPLVIDWRAPAASPSTARRRATTRASSAAACCAAAVSGSSASRTTSWSPRRLTTWSSSATAPSWLR